MNSNAQTAPSYTPRTDLAEPGSEATYAGWRQRHHIQIGMQTIVKVARTRDERDRDALLWLANYAHREQATADSLTEQLGVDRPAIRAALTNPDADIRQLVKKIESLRAVLDANLRAPADTEFNRLVEKACRFSMAKGMIVEVIAKTRTGKTSSADAVHLRNMHRALYFECPDAESEKDFIYAFAAACGVSVGNGKTVPQIKDQIKSMFGRRGFNFLIVDEGHRLWPMDITGKPKRVEFLREIWDKNKRSVGICVLSTPQATINSNEALSKSKRWSPGQWEGRLVRFKENDAVPQADVVKVAEWHCTEGDALVRQLVRFGRVSPGFYGAMINSLELARFEADELRKPLSVEILRMAQKQMIKGTVLEHELKAKGVEL